MSSTSIDAPMKGHTLNKDYGDSHFILEGDYLYYGSGGARAAASKVGNETNAPWRPHPPAEVAAD